MDFFKRKEPAAPAPAVQTSNAGHTQFASSTPVKFNSVEFRDGVQSLLATRVTTEDIRIYQSLLRQSRLKAGERWMKTLWKT